MCCERRNNGSAAESTTEVVVARVIGPIGISFLRVLGLGPCMAVSHLFGCCFEVREQKVRRARRNRPWKVDRPLPRQWLIHPFSAPQLVSQLLS